jgi:hypothetical protein
MQQLYRAKEGGTGQPERSAKYLRCYRQGFEDLLLGKFPGEKNKPR